MKGGIANKGPGNLLIPTCEADQAPFAMLDRNETKSLGLVPLSFGAGRVPLEYWAWPGGGLRCVGWGLSEPGVKLGRYTCGRVQSQVGALGTGLQSRSWDSGALGYLGGLARLVTCKTLNLGKHGQNTPHLSFLSPKSPTFGSTLCKLEHWLSHNTLFLHCGKVRFSQLGAPLSHIDRILYRKIPSLASPFTEQACK